MTTRRPPKPLALDEATATQLAEVFDVFSDPSRVRIISVLAAGEQHASAIAEAVDLSNSALSHQMRVLRNLRLVVARKLGRQVFYVLDDHVARLYEFGLDHLKHD